MYISHLANTFICRDCNYSMVFKEPRVLKVSERKCKKCNGLMLSSYETLKLNNIINRKKGKEIPTEIEYRIRSMKALEGIEEKLYKLVCILSSAKMEFNEKNNRYSENEKKEKETRIGKGVVEKFINGLNNIHDRTMKELIELSGIKRDTLVSYCNRHNIKYKKVYRSKK